MDSLLNWRFHLLISRIHYENTIFCQHYFLPTSSGLIGYFANSSGIYYLFRKYTMNALFVPRIHYNFTTFFGIKLCLHYLFREYIKKSRFVSRSHHKSTICLTFSIWIKYLFCEFTMNWFYVSWLNCEFTIYSPIHYEFTFCFTNSILIYYLFREFTFNSLFFTNSQWITYRIHYESFIIFRVFTMQLMSFTRI